MTNMNEAAKRAAKLANGVRQEVDRVFTAQDFAGNLGPVPRAYMELIQHVSEVAKQAKRDLEALTRGPVKYLDALILPNEPDTLVEALKEAGFGTGNDNGRIDRLRAALKAHGLQITEVPK